MNVIDRKVIFREYAPDVFAALRKIDDVEMDMVKKTLDPRNPKTIEAIKKSGEGLGRSGSFFFFSDDKKLLVKSMK